MRWEARPVAPTSAAFPIGRCARSYRRSNASGSVGAGYSTRSLTLMMLSSLDVSDEPHAVVPGACRPLQVDEAAEPRWAADMVVGSPRVKRAWQGITPR